MRVSVEKHTDMQMHTIVKTVAALLVAAAFAAALCTAGMLGIPLRALGRGIGAVLRLPSRILHRFAVQPLHRRRAAAKTARKLRRNAERTAKKSKKNLPNQRALLYNSNVSK